MHALLALGAGYEMLESHADSFRKAYYFSAALRAYAMLMETTADPSTRARYLVRMGQCHEELGEVGRAYDSVTRAMELDMHAADPAIRSQLRKSSV
jgi:hypothetical protein